MSGTAGTLYLHGGRLRRGFWTRLGLLAQGPGFSTQPEEQLLRWGRHYGMGLQLVNILRDREEDLARGRSYCPPQMTVHGWTVRNAG